jgi:GAF domain-containing protein
MSADENPVLSALARAAAELTEAAGAAVVAVRGEEIVVLASRGPDPQRAVGDRLGPGDQAVRFVLAGGQSMSLAPAAAAPEGVGTDDPRTAARASMCLPCIGEDGAIGALELHGRLGHGPFDVAATRVAALLADVACAELAVDRGGATAAPSPGELSAELVQLAARDRARYEAVALALGALLAGG